MLKFALALALATAAPTFALAQDSYDEYCDPSGQCSYRYDDDQDYSRYGRDYGYERDYDRDYGDRGDYDYSRGYDYGRGNEGGGYAYTGRVGSRWIDEEGRRCAWREVTWLDTDGYRATKWIADCR